MVAPCGGKAPRGREERVGVLGDDDEAEIVAPKREEQAGEGENEPGAGGGQGGLNKPPAHRGALSALRSTRLRPPLSARRARGGEEQGGRTPQEASEEGEPQARVAEPRREGH